MTGWDEQGRILEWVTETEPEWDDETRATVLAYGQLQTVHGPCGQTYADAISTMHGWRVHHELCQACAAMRTVRDKWHQDHKGKDHKSDVDQRIFWVEKIPLPT